MIDITLDEQPSHIDVFGIDYKVHTDFRVWVKYGKVRSKEGVTLADLSFVFDGVCPPPCKETVIAMDMFYVAPSARPRVDEEGSKEPVFDYIEDGDYIFSSILAVYHINICHSKIHWFEFHAMVLSLPETSKLMRIIGYASWSEADEKRKPVEVKRKLKRIWTLPDIEAEKEKQAALDEINSMFGQK